MTKFIIYAAIAAVIFYVVYSSYKKQNEPTRHGTLHRPSTPNATTVVEQQPTNTLFAD